MTDERDPTLEGSETPTQEAPSEEAPAEEVPAQEAPTEEEIARSAAAIVPGAPTEAEMREMRREAMENDAAHDDPADLEHQLGRQLEQAPEITVPERGEVTQLTEQLRPGFDPARVGGNRAVNEWLVFNNTPPSDVLSEASPDDVPDDAPENEAPVDISVSSARIRIREAVETRPDRERPFGYNLYRLDTATAYRVDMLSRMQLDTLTLHGIDFTILQQPDVEPQATDQCFTIMVEHNVLSPIQRRLQIIFTGYSEVNDIEGVMGLNWIPYTWPEGEEPDNRAMTDPPVDETDQLDGSRATAIILDDPLMEPPAPPEAVFEDPPPVPPEAVEEEPPPVPEAQEYDHTNRLRRPHPIPRLGTPPAFVTFVERVNALLPQVEYREIEIFSHIAIGIVSGRNRPLHCLLDDVWPIVDNLDVPTNLNQVEDEFNDFADDNEYEEIERRAHLYCYTGHFSAEDMEDLLSQYDMTPSMPAPLPFYYYHYVLRCFEGSYAMAQEIGMSMLINTFIELAADTFGDDLSASRMNTIMRALVPIDAHMQAIPELEPEARPIPADTRRRPVIIDPLWERNSRDFVDAWNELLIDATDDDLNTLYDLYAERARQPRELVTYHWPGEWFPGLPTDIDTARTRLERYVSEGNARYVPPYFNMIAATNLMEELALDEILEAEGFDVTEVGQQPLYMFPVILKMYTGDYLEATQSAVKMLSCPFMHLMADHLGEDLSAPEINTTMGFLTDRPERVFPVEMHQRSGEEPIYTVGATAVAAATPSRVQALHAVATEAAEPKKPEKPKPLLEGFITFSTTKAPIHAAFEDEEADYWEIAEALAENLGINIGFISRDAANVPPFTAGGKQHRIAGSEYSDYMPRLIPEFAKNDKGMVKDNTLYVHVYARPNRSVLIKKLIHMPDRIILDMNLSGEGDPVPKEINVGYDGFIEARCLRYNLMQKTTPSGEPAVSPPTLRADFIMNRTRTWGDMNSGDIVLARFSDPQNLYVNFQMLRFDTEVSFQMYEHIINWIERMVYFDVGDVDEKGNVLNGKMRWTPTAWKFMANDQKRLHEKRIMGYIRTFKSTVIGSLPELQERLDKIQAEITSLTSQLITKGKEQNSTVDRIVGVRKKDGEFTEKLRTEIEAISDMEGIRSFKINTDGLTAETEYLLLHDERTDDWYELGECSISLLTKGELSIINKTRQCEGIKKDMNHPHVYPSGNPCLGDLTRTVPSYFGTASIAALVDIALQLLVNVNSADTAGAYVTKWPKCEPQLQKFLNEKFKSKFQAGRIGHAAYKQHLIDKETKPNVLQHVRYGTATVGGSGFPTDEELEAGAYIDAAGNITPGPSDSGQTPAGGRGSGAPGGDSPGGGELRARSSTSPGRGQLLPSDFVTGTDG